MKKIFSVIVVMLLLCCSALVHAGATSGRMTASGWEITDDGSISVVKGTRYAPYSAGVCSSQTLTIRPVNGQVQTLTLASHGTCTIDWIQPSEGVQTVWLIVTQGTASAPMAWTSTLWPSGVVSTMSITSGAIDLIPCHLTATQRFCSSTQNYK